VYKSGNVDHCASFGVDGLAGFTISGLYTTTCALNTSSGLGFFCGYDNQTTAVVTCGVLASGTDVTSSVGTLVLNDWVDIEIHGHDFLASGSNWAAGYVVFEVNGAVVLTVEKSQVGTVSIANGFYPFISAINATSTAGYAEVDHFAWDFERPNR
jgi:hypothetical protein